MAGPELILGDDRRTGLRRVNTNSAVGNGFDGGGLLIVATLTKDVWSTLVVPVTK